MVRHAHFVVVFIHEIGVKQKQGKWDEEEEEEEGGGGEGIVLVLMYARTWTEG